jgi:hypothetical protein
MVHPLNEWLGDELRFTLTHEEPMLTVFEALSAFANEQNVPLAGLLQARIAEHCDSSLPLRYRNLATDVYLRLPDGWDSQRTWRIIADLDMVDDISLASARVLDDQQAVVPRWEIRLHCERLGRFSPAAVAWVIVQQFVHVASSGQPQPPKRKDAVSRHHADVGAAWGFGAERQIFEAECETSRS